MEIQKPTITDFTNATHTHANAANGGQISLTAAVTGILPKANGGVGIDLTATGGTSQVLKQTSLGGAITVAQLSNTDISGLGTLATQNGTFSGTSSGTNTGDQNLFSTIAVSGQSNVVADSTSDTLTLEAGSNITLTTNASTDTITISSSSLIIGGSTTQVQYNNAGALAGASNFVYSNNSVGIGGSPASAGSLLDVQSTTQVFSLPRMTSSQLGLVNTTNLPSGSLAFDTDLKTLRMYRSDVTTWIAAGAPSITLAQGRLTVVSGNASPNATATGATTLYYTPYIGNRWLYILNGVSYTGTFSETSISVSGLTADKNYDVFAYATSVGVLTLELLAWTDSITRATGITMSPFPYKTGDSSRHYLGTIRTNASGSVDHTVSKCGVWNFYNRLPKEMYYETSTSSWTYSTATWRAANNSSSSRIEIINGIADTSMMVQCQVYRTTCSPSADVVVELGIGYDSTTTNIARRQGRVANTGGLTGTGVDVTATHTPAIGYHYYSWNEYGDVDSTVTWYAGTGNGSRIQAIYLC